MLFIWLLCIVFVFVSVHACMSFVHVCVLCERVVLCVCVYLCTCAYAYACAFLCKLVWSVCCVLHVCPLSVHVHV